jgi:hypothetical protein
MLRCGEGCVRVAVAVLAVSRSVSTRRPDADREIDSCPSCCGVGLFTVWSVLVLVLVLGQVRTLLSSPRCCLRRLHVLHARMTPLCIEIGIGKIEV